MTDSARPDPQRPDPQRPDTHQADHPAPLVDYAVRGSAAHLTLDSPHNHNALSTRLIAELRESLAQAAADPAVRAIVLGHTGGTFCAGADLTEAGTPRSRTMGMVGVMRALLTSPKPILAVVDGHVRAGGFGLLGACDFVYAGPRSSFALTEVKLGVAAAMVSVVVLPHLGTRAAAQALLTGERFDAATAQRIGFITAAVDDPAAAAATQVQVLREASPQSLHETRELLWRPILADLNARAEELAAQSARLFESDEAREGITALLSKRRPNWAT